MNSISILAIALVAAAAQTPDCCAASESTYCEEIKLAKNPKTELRTQEEILSEEAEVTAKDDGRIYEAVEQQAQYPGGQKAMMEWIGANIRYPKEAEKNRIEGRVIVKLTINRDGSVVNPVIVRGVHNLLDEEALRVVGLMPKWVPGKINGEAVCSYFYLPFVFRLPKDK